MRSLVHNAECGERIDGTPQPFAQFSNLRTQYVDNIERLIGELMKWDSENPVRTDWIKLEHYAERVWGRVQYAGTLVEADAQTRYLPTAAAG